MGQRAYAALMLVLAVVLFFGINAVSGTLLRQARLDLTQNKLYTLSDGTKAILHGLKEPITLRFYYSEEAALNYPDERAFAGRVRDLLDAFERESRGKVVVEVIKPKPFTDTEDQASDAGLVAASVNGGSLYLGIEGTNLGKGREVIPFLSSQRESMLEYDLTMMIERLSTDKKPVVGILTGLPLPEGYKKPYRIYREIAASYSVKALQSDMTRVPDDIKTLVIIDPQRLTPSALYAIDQFALRGGHVLAFLDPFSEITNNAAHGQPADGSVSATLDPLLKAWGVAMPTDGFVADRKLGLSVVATSQGVDRQVKYVPWLGLGQSEMNAKDPVTSGISTLNVATIGEFKTLPGATTKVTPLIRSTVDSMLVPTAAVQYAPDPEALLNEFRPSGPYTLAVRITGQAKTAYPEGPPPPTPKEGETVKPAPLPPQIMQSKAGVQIILVADTDLFEDQFWVNMNSVMGQEVAVPIADNANFVLNAIENLSGSNSLAGLRGRPVAARKFTRVEALKTKAEIRYLSEQRSLEQKLKATEKRLSQLERQGGDSGRIVITEAERKEIEGARAEAKTTRLKLREVQRNLRADVDRLGNWLKFFNIGLMPLLVALVAVGLAISRRRARTRQARAQMRTE